MHHRWLRRFIGVLVVLVAASCDRAPTRPQVSSISITPSAPQLSVGDTIELEASVRDAAGNSLPDQPVFWASSDTSVVTVSATGMIATRAPGSAQIAASARGESGFATILVIAPAVATVRIEPGSTTLDALGDTARLVVHARDGGGSPIAAPQAVWSTSAPEVVAISSSGIATAVRNGVATITATLDGSMATATVTVAQRVSRVAVSPASAALTRGDTVRYTAVATDENAYPITSAEGLTWSSSNTVVARVDGSGLVVGASTGEAQITASLNGVTGSGLAAVALLPVGAVEVTPAAATVEIGAAVDLRTTIRDERGNPLEGRSVSWTSEDPTIATVDANGKVRGRAPGSATIRAASGGRSGTAVITVTVPPVASIEVVYADDAPGTLRVGGAVQLAAIARDAAGNVVPGIRVLWSSSDRSIATVDEGGYVRARGVGSVRITATAEGKTGSLLLDIAPPAVASVEITPDSVSLPVGGKIQLVAIPRDAGGDALPNRNASWSSGNSETAKVDSKGNVTALATGSTLIVATVESRSGTARVVVVTPPPVPVASVRITPSSGEVVVGSSMEFDAQPLDAGGNVLSGRQIVWTADKPAIATVSGKGTVRGVAPGQTTITATSEGVSASVPITVNRVPVSSVEVTPAAETVVVGREIQLTAIPRAADGSELAGREVRWSSSDESVARVDEMGIVRGVAPGAATITATAEGKSGSAEITVAPRPVASVMVEPAAATLETGNTVQLRAQPRDAENNVLTGRPVVWTTSDTRIATVDEDGVVHGIAPGSATIFATSEGVRGEASIIVLPPPVASVAVTPATGSVQVGQTLRLAAFPLDRAGNPLQGRPVSWTSSNRDVATVGENGEVRGIGPGEAIITATSEGRSGSATISVTPPPPAPVASVRITPSSGEVLVGNTIDFDAQPVDADGNVLAGRQIVWTSANRAVATVDENGTVRGVAAGRATITATSEGSSGTAEVAVTPRPVASVTLEPDSARLVRGESIQLEATLRDGRGTVLTGRRIAWSSADPAIASVDDDGTVSALAPGSTTIAATAEGIRAEARIIVDRVPVASVTVTPSTASVEVGQTIALAAVPRDAAGNALQGRPVSWTTSDGAIAVVDENGEVQGIALGEATITATSEGEQGTAAITVTAPPPAPVTSIQVSPDTATIQIGGSMQLAAVVRDADGNVLTDREVTWSSDDSSIAGVDGEGTVAGISAGATSIVATAEGVSASARITVEPPAPARLDYVSGSGQQGKNNQALADPLVVRVVDDAGNPVEGIEVRWSTDNTRGRGGVSPSISQTDEDGRASTTWTLGGGNNNDVRRAWADADGLERVEFTATVNDDD